MNKFNKQADQYNRHSSLQKRASLALFDMLPKSPQRIIDIGCGTGYDLTKFKIKFPAAEIIGCDSSNNMLEISNQENHAIFADANNLDFKVNSFDLIYSNLLVQWLQDLDKFFSDTIKFCQNNGTIIGSTLGPNTLLEAKSALKVIGRSNSVNSFLDMHTIGDKLYKAGWKEVYVGTEEIILKFDNPMGPFINLKNTGATKSLNPGRKKHFITPRSWQKVLDNYPKTNGCYYASYELITFRAKKKSAGNECNISEIKRTK